MRATHCSTVVLVDAVLNSLEGVGGHTPEHFRDLPNLPPLRIIEHVFNVEAPFADNVQEMVVLHVRHRSAPGAALLVPVFQLEDRLAVGQGDVEARTGHLFLEEHCLHVLGDELVEDANLAQHRR